MTKTLASALIAVAGCFTAASPQTTMPSPIVGEPGVAAPLPPKTQIDPRLASFSVGGDAIVGETFGAEAYGVLRLLETIGIGLGARATSTSSFGFMRFDALGLAINHWSFLAYADLSTNGNWGFGGAMLVPVRKKNYVRVSLGIDENSQTLFGVGMEHDLW